MKRITLKMAGKNTNAGIRIVNINRNLYGSSTSTRNAVAQLGLNFILGK